jgi:hypothetical protein
MKTAGTTPVSFILAEGSARFAGRVFDAARARLRIL